MKELADLYKEESQILGYGSGCDPWLYDAVKRHRQNEQSFRFKTSNEIIKVENERRRLEKERREMDESESFFYDFADLKVVYEFDQRHAKLIKNAGIFRQGLQWTEEELRSYEDKKIIDELRRLKNNGLPESLVDSFDPLSTVEEPPPTFRAADERRKAQYKETMFFIGRLQNFSKRINDLKLSRYELASAKQSYSDVLVSLHKDSYLLEIQLQELECDLDRTSKLLSTLAKMKRLLEQSNKIKMQALKEKKKAEMHQCGVWDDVKECHDRTSVVHDETRFIYLFIIIVFIFSQILFVGLCFEQK
jgi:hypothetical protein